MARTRKRKSRWRRNREDDAVECGCCLADAFASWVLVAGVVVWRRRRR